MPVPMVVVAAIALAGDVPIAVLAVVLVLVVNTAVWFALTERGAWRVFGAVAVVLAGGGLVVVLATHWQGLLTLIVLLLLLALFGFAARYALGRAGEVAVNGAAAVAVPVSGAGSAALIGLDRDDVVGALDAFADGVERRIDLARVNDRVFVNNASLGVYAKVVQSDAYRDAELETWTRMLPDLLGSEADPVDLALTLPNGTNCDDAPLVLVSNNPYELTHLSAPAHASGSTRACSASWLPGSGAPRSPSSWR